VLIRAQLWALPAATAVAPLPIRNTGTGVLLFVAGPLPSCPLPLAPQHWTPPLASSAQVWALPADTLNAAAIPETDTGELLAVVVPLPSRPLPLNPQHRTPPLASCAQVCSAPAETCTYVSAWTGVNIEMNVNAKSTSTCRRSEKNVMDMDQPRNEEHRVPDGWVEHSDKRIIAQHHAKLTRKHETAAEFCTKSRQRD